MIECSNYRTMNIECIDWGHVTWKLFELVMRFCQVNETKAAEDYRIWIWDDIYLTDMIATFKASRWTF